MGLIGVVMAGGKSSRMGEDKGLLLSEGKCFSVIAYEKLSLICDRVAVAINKSQASLYKDIFLEKQLIIDKESYKGPFCAMLSLYDNLYDNLGFIGKVDFAEDALFLLACDMINMDLELMKSISKAYLSNKDHDFFVYRHGQNEPLCALYKLSFIEKLRKQTPPYSSFKRALSKLGKAFYLNLDEGKKRYFRSINTKKELKEYSKEQLKANIKANIKEDIHKT